MSNTERWRVPDVNLELGEDEALLGARAAAVLGVPADLLLGVELHKRSIDARGRRAPRFVHIVDVTVPAGSVTRVPNKVVPSPVYVPPPVRTVAADAARPLVIGMGPCGLFAALRLAEAGLRPVIVDRGKNVEARAKDVSRLMSFGEINPDSNLCYGEGGAGTWSDGKLYTRVGGEYLRHVLDRIVELGGPERILVDGRPHLGTDRLVAILKNFRATLGAFGCEVRFDTAVRELRGGPEGVRGVVLEDGSVIDADRVILAPGHSARELYRRLIEQRIELQPKAFSVGFRIEHPQALIDEIQYGRWAGHEGLPAAYYELATRFEDTAPARAVYSFCMCPGGSVVPTPTREGEVCVNGMSHAARSGRYANSALVVSVEPSDFASFAASDSDLDRRLAGVAFQRAAETRAWELGGGAFVAPAQRVPDFIAGRASTEVRRTTYKRGVNPADLSGLYPEHLRATLVEGCRRLDHNFRGYVSDEAVLIGVETRTSAPVTIVRDRTTLESVSMRYLYPAGEGAGYGGGIVSAAIDGLRAADALLASL